MSGENALTWGKVSITNKHGLKATLTNMRTNTLLLVLKKTCIIARMTILSMTGLVRIIETNNYNITRSINYSS